MPRTDNEVRITPSLLDRLLDYEPELSREPIASRAKSLRRLKQSVKRDLEWLLNTRHTSEELALEMKELKHSVATYGLPDFSNINSESPEDQALMRQQIEDAIQIFEPRLEDVMVTIEPTIGAERMMRFRIDARLKIEPAPEPVTFDTVLSGNGKYIVEGD